MSSSAEKVYSNRPAPKKDETRVSLFDRLRYYLPTIIIFFAVLLLWEVLVRALQIKQFIMPAPSSIFEAFRASLAQMIALGVYTGTEALGGFILGCGLGIAVALATARWTAARETLLPLAIAANSVPIIAFAPIMNNWFGITNQTSKMAIVAVITFFPMMINMTRGLTLVDPSALELMRSYAVNEWTVLREVRIPNSLPYMFNAFKICSTLALIGAVVGEFFGGTRDALGVYITQEAALFRFENSWAAIVIACLLGIGFYVLIVAIERLVIPWHASVRKTEE
ncbi:MAG: ABC transporter permease [Chloroflexota bacterium]|nr:MAG: ABC transporter permease [Chloroflexota bacterium]